MFMQLYNNPEQRNLYFERDEIDIENKYTKEKDDYKKIQKYYLFKNGFVVYFFENLLLDSIFYTK